MNRFAHPAFGSSGPVSCPPTKPEVPRRKVAGIGNVLRHEYMDVAPEAIWAVVQDHLPALRRAVLTMIASLERNA